MLFVWQRQSDVPYWSPATEAWMKPVSALFSSPRTQWQSHRASAAEQTCVSTLTLQLIASVPSTQPKWSHSIFYFFFKQKQTKKDALKLSGWSSWGGKSSTTSSDSRDRQQLLHLHFYLTKKYLKTHVWGRFTYHDFVWGSKRKRRKRKREEKGVKNRASRVVPSGVDATTAEWEGGALRFIYAGQEDQLLCAEGGKKKPLLPPFENAVPNTAYSSVFRIQICKLSPLKHLL